LNNTTFQATFISLSPYSRFFESLRNKSYDFSNITHIAILKVALYQWFLDINPKRVLQIRYVRLGMHAPHLCFIMQYYMDENDFHYKVSCLYTTKQSNELDEWIDKNWTYKDKSGSKYHKDHDGNMLLEFLKQSAKTYGDIRCEFSSVNHGFIGGNLDAHIQSVNNEGKETVEITPTGIKTSFQYSEDLFNALLSLVRERIRYKRKTISKWANKDFERLTGGNYY
jgi:hypothetical protein